jgi:hypothetical protein
MSNHKYILLLIKLVFPIFMLSIFKVQIRLASMLNLFSDRKTSLDYQKLLRNLQILITKSFFDSETMLAT